MIRARTLSTALWCSVMPSVQQIIALSALANAWASSRMAAAGHARLALGVLEGVALDLGLVGLEVGRRPIDELAVREPGVDDLAPDRVREGDVRPDVEAQPDVGPLGRARPPRVDRVQAGAVADAFEEVVEEDRMRLPGIAAPEHDQVGLFSLAI